MMGGDGGINQIAMQPPEPRKNAILVSSREPGAVADDIGDQDRCYLAALAAHASAVIFAGKPIRARRG
jgi:hypothetical protein